MYGNACLSHIGPMKMQNTKPRMPSTANVFSFKRSSLYKMPVTCLVLDKVALSMSKCARLHNVDP